MFNVLTAPARAEAFGRTYATFLRHVEVDLAPLPEGVHVELADSRLCGCREDGCYFCDALDFAVWEAARLEDEAEQAERYGTGWYVHSSGGQMFDDED